MNEAIVQGFDEPERARREQFLFQTADETVTLDLPTHRLTKEEVLEWTRFFREATWH